MAASRRHPPFYVLNHEVSAGTHLCGRPGDGWHNRKLRASNPTGDPGPRWTELEILRRQAYGCGANICEALNGLSLHALLGDDPLVTSSLAIRLSREALKSFNSELQIGAPKDYKLLNLNDRMKVLGSIVLMDEEQDLMIMNLVLRREDVGGLSYYLVYDHRKSSLSIISDVPDSLNIIGMLQPVPKRTSGDYELFFMVRDSDDDSDTSLPPFLCVFSPAKVTEASNSNLSSRWKMKSTKPACPWWEMKRVKWNVPVTVQRFLFDMTFFFQGKGFWADLSQALIYCDLRNSDSIVDFGCIELPSECLLDLDDALDCEEPMKVSRTMGCVRGSIRFACIHRGRSHADDSVTMWTLKLPQGQWTNEARFPVRELWRFDGFQEAGLPKTKVGYPVLTADGALCLVLAGRIFEFGSSDVSSEDHICTFDIHNKRLLWHGSVYDHSVTETVVFPSDFFQRKWVSTGPVKSQGA